MMVKEADATRKTCFKRDVINVSHIVWRRTVLKRAVHSSNYNVTTLNEANNRKTHTHISKYVRNECAVFSCGSSPVQTAATHIHWTLRSNVICSESIWIYHPFYCFSSVVHPSRISSQLPFSMSSTAYDSPHRRRSKGEKNVRAQTLKCNDCVQH